MRSPYCIVCHFVCLFVVYYLHSSLPGNRVLSSQPSEIDILPHSILAYCGTTSHSTGGRRSKQTVDACEIPLQQHGGTQRAVETFLTEQARRRGRGWGQRVRGIVKARQEGGCHTPGARDKRIALRLIHAVIIER